MDAPKCRLCGERHYGACPSFETKGSGRKIIAGLRDAIAHSNGDESAAKIHTVRVPAQPQAEPLKTWRRGRRIAAEAHLVVAKQKPWEALGMSRATYYRRKGKGEL